ncbi:glycosyltransferase family 4 protein [Enterovibrio baiacu]|uniref:glycosyltransferase family 4 protein n=1 Tax=Enterovibrio baiacu TaxID=2491023 RepID=UPI003D0CD27B
MMKKKILFIVNVDWYFKLHWIDRVRYFQSIGYEVTILTSFTSQKHVEDIEAMGISCLRMTLRRKSINIFGEILSWWEIYRTIKNVNPDMIHSITIKPNLYSGIINKFFFKKPIVYSITGLGLIFSSSRKKFAIIRRVVTYLYRFISTGYSHYIFENEEDRRKFELLAILKNGNGTLVKGAGINLELYSPSRSSPPLRGVILFGARLLEDKGLRSLVDAVRLLRDQGIDVTLNVAGILDEDAHLAIPLSQILDWERKGDINWLGNVDNMPVVIAESDIVCLPTTYGEGVPRILIEAASCQRAIVASDVAGCREIVFPEINGYLTPPNDPISLSVSLKKLLTDNNKVVSFGIEGRKIVENDFSQEMVFENTLSVYRKVTSS